jgi:alanyl-tRNA synthetase
LYDNRVIAEISPDPFFPFQHMTHRLYYTQPGLREFEATVVADGHIGGRPFAVLDRTAFYPASGGQPFDTGMLNGVCVLEVIDRDDESVAHVVETAIAVGTAVRGVIDWPRRLDHMQQHTGQHILSAAFERLHRARTVGFHLGADVSTVDLSREVTADEIAAAEDASNAVVREDRAVTVRFATAEEAATLPLRKEPTRGGMLRLIDVDGFDLSACGGTHVARSGEVGAIHVLTSERFRGGVRLEFVCGARAVRAFRRYRDAVAGCIRTMSVSPEELPAAVERLQAEHKDLRKALKSQQDELAKHEAIALADGAIQAGERRLVVESIAERDAAALKSLAAAIAARPGYDVVLLSDEAPYLVVIVRSPGGALDAPTVLRKLVERFGGKGGGRGDMAQGGGLAGAKAEILDEAKRLLASTSS